MEVQPRDIQNYQTTEGKIPFWQNWANYCRKKKDSEIYCLSALLNALGFQLTVTIKESNS
jgi:hypothetical protein